MYTDRRSYHSDVVTSSSPPLGHLPLTLRPQDRASVVNAVVEDITSRMQRKEKSKLKFICDKDLQLTIYQHADRLFAFERWEMQQIEQVLRECYQVLGILVYIGAFTHLRSLKDIFFNNGEITLAETAITNRKLWVRDESQLQFLGSAILRNYFLDMQWIFKPYTFREEKPSKRLDVPANARLPFTHASKEIGTGAFGRVSAVIVAGRQYMNATGQLYENPMDCALKQLKTSRDLLRELKQLEIIKESLVKHERVLMHYVSFTHGETFNILLPLAKYGNLEQLLNEGTDPGSPTGNVLYDFRERFRRFDWRKKKCIQDLLDQIANIVGAVKWLHSGDVLKLEIIHRDLKPDNILIMEDPTSDPEQKSTIGLWQLSDLGISVLQPYAPEAPENDRTEAGDPNNTVTIGDFVSLIENQNTLSNRTAGGARNSRMSKTLIQRPPGTYTAPEVERQTIAKESDVWSLACIFAEVVAFAIGGRDKVREFEEFRQRGKFDNFFYSPMQQLLLGVPSLETSDFMVRPAVSTWLNGLADEHGEWVKCCVKIILKALVVDVEQRPKASDLHKMLLHAKDHHLVPAQSGKKCPHLHPGLTPMSSPPAQFPPPTSPPSQTQPPRQLPYAETEPQPPPQSHTQLSPQSSPRSHSQPYPHPYTQPYPQPADQYPPLQAQPQGPTSQHYPQPQSPPQTQSQERPRARPRPTPASPPPPPQPTIGNGRGVDRRSSSGTSGNRSDVPSFQSLQLSLELSKEEHNKIPYLQKKRPKGKMPPAIDVSVCPNGEYALWLFKTQSKPHPEFEIDLTSLDPSLDGSRRGSALGSQQFISLDNTIPLPTGVDWVKLEYAYHYAVIQGKSFKKTENTKYFRFYDLEQHPPRRIITTTHPEMARVGLGNIAVSTLGFAVLRANTKLLLFDLRPDSCTPDVLEPTEKKYWFSETSFSPSGDRLIAWCYGKEIDDAIYLWNIDQSTRQVSPAFRYEIMTNKGCQAPVMSILPSPQENEDGSIDCIVREDQDRKGRFFLVRLSTSSNQKLARDYLTKEANGALAATIYKGTHLITLVRNATGKAGQVLNYPLQASRQSQRKLEPSRLGPFSPAIGRKMRIITHSQGLSVVTLALDTQYSRTWFREA